MFNSRTLFIIGAGASKEVGLPIGSELARSIGERLSFRFEAIKQTHGDREIYRALKLRCQELKDPAKIREYADAAWRISDRLPLSNSIDDFIDTHRGDEYVELCGKLAIAKLILESERRSHLYFDPTSECPSGKLGFRLRVFRDAAP